MFKNFICTSDKETADKLKDLGFVLLDFKNEIYTFSNNVKCNFEESKIDKSNFLYTNRLTFDG